MNDSERRAYDRAWRKANPGKVRAKAERWRQRHPRKYAAYHKARRAALPSRYHGMTYAQLLLKLKAQGNRCGICRTDSPGKARWHGDHDHKTGKFRGVLCGRCNLGLGLFRDNVDLLTQARRYLRKV